MLAFAAGAAVGAAAAYAACRWQAARRRAALGRFLSFAGHELNSPLTAVTMTVSNLAAGVFGSTPEEQGPWLDILREQVSRLSGLVAELRDFVHVDLKGDLLIQLEDEPASDLAQKAAGLVRGGMKQAKVPLELSIPQALPPVRCDPERSARILQSLLYHARKFRTEGPVTLRARAEHAKVVFEIEYEASTPVETDACFDLYYPASVGKQTLAATGLGLGLLRVLARRQGGSLVLSSNGKARLLAFTLPSPK